MTGQHITISFAGYNRAWAAWIGDRLERHGVRVAFQRWNPPLETPLEQALEDLLLVEGRILVVLSDWYFKLGPRPEEAWNKALRAVIAPNRQRFAAVSVTSQPLPNATTAFGGSADLWGIGAREAERRLLNLLGVTPSAAADSPAEGGPRYPHEQPRVWGGVPRRNTRFTGREDALQSIYDLFQRAEPGAAVVSLLGLSGVGKSQIASEYVHRFGSEYDVVWWVPADQRGTLRQRLAELAPSLGLTTGHDYGERLRAVADALRRGDPYSRWLLVLDGADSPEAVADMVLTGTGHVLITSQNRQWAEYNSVLYDTPVFDRDESVAFIRRRAPRIDADEAHLLADALGDHPLALDQTAGWLSDSTVTVQQYVDLLRAGGGRVEAALKVSSDFPMPYHTAFSILLNRLRETMPEAVHLLRLCSFFAPGAVPVRLLRAIPTEHLPEQPTGLFDDEVLWSTAINRLVQYSVIQWDAANPQDEEDAGTIHLHRMVSQSVRVAMSEEDQRAYALAVRRGLSAANPENPSDSRTWRRFALITPHLESSGCMRSRNGHSHRLIYHCLQYLRAAGEYRDGIQLAERIRLHWHELFDTDDQLVCDLDYMYANLLREHGSYALAEELDRSVAERFTRTLGPDHLRAQLPREGLSEDLRGLGRYPESLEIIQGVLNAYLKLIGENDVRTLNVRDQVASSLRLLGRYAETFAYDRRTLELRRDVVGPRHATALYVETMYALDLRLLGRYDEARSVQEETVRVQRIVVGPDHPSTLMSELNLALCLLRTGEREQARPRLAQVLERAERVLGLAHPLAVRTATAYAVVERGHGNLDRAREIGESAVERYRDNLGPRHPYAVGAAANLAVVLRTVGELQASQLLIEECLTGMTAAVGPDHPWTLGVALNASAGRHSEGDIEGAAELSRDTAGRATTTLGQRHPLSLAAQVALSHDVRALRRRSEADRLEKEALSGLIETLGSQHSQTVNARSRQRPSWDFEPLT